MFDETNRLEVINIIGHDWDENLYIISISIDIVSVNKLFFIEKISSMRFYIRRIDHWYSIRYCALLR